MVKILWILIGLNGIALLIFIGAYFVLTQGRNVSQEESGWTFILAGTGLLVILLAAVPLRFSQSTGTLIFSGIFAALPLAILLGIFISKKLASIKTEKSFAETYYKNKTQKAIASAIEKNDTVLLQQLIKGQNLNIQGIRVWDRDGLGYLQYAIRLRSMPISFPFNDTANTAAIRILLANGADAKPALAEACQYLPVSTIALLLNAGADPNCPGFVNLNPLLFEVIENKKIDIAILLIEKGADVNAIKDTRFTPLMYAAKTTDTTKKFNDTWRLVCYLLEKTNADYTYADRDGNNLAAIIQNIRKAAATNNVTMSPDFIAVVAWLKKHGIDTTPLPEIKLPGAAAGI